jgi:hypothetical protein
MSSLRLSRSLALAAVGCTLAIAHADQLSAFPRLSVADGRSTTTITADIRDSQGRPVPNGTRVVFNTTLGSFRETVATTTNGIARAILVSGGTPGIAKITATPLAGGAGSTTFEFEFVADRAMLSSAREYIEIVAPGVMHYTVDTRLIGAAGVNKGVSVRFRDIEIEADDVQVNIPTYEVRARKARLKIGKFTKDFDELYLKLNQRHGYGTTTFRGRAPQFLTVQGRWLALATERADGTLSFEVPPEQDRYGLVEIKGPSITPATTVAPASMFEFEELVGSPSRITAKKAVIFPGKQIQFQKADIYVADNRVMRLPLYQVNMAQSTSPIITEDLVGVNNNTVAVNYPYFLSLKPGQTSLLRFRTGEAFGGGSYTGSRGAFMDYELNWNRGDDMDGAIAVRGIGRSDYRVGFQQFYRMDSRSTASAQFDLVPRDRSVFGSGNVGRQFNGFQVNLSGSSNRQLTGSRYQSQDVSLIGETDPRRLGRSPFQLVLGLTANSSSHSLLVYNDKTKKQELQSGSMSGSGVRARLQSSPININRSTNLTTSFSAAKLQGTNVLSGMTLNGSATLSKSFGNGAAVLLTYDYLRDGFNEKVVGQHRLSTQAYWYGGRTSVRLFGSRSLDLDRLNLNGDLEYRLNGVWRLSSSYSLDRYHAGDFSSNFLDYNFAIGYRIGWREIGLVWSKRTNRIGIQFLGASLN